MSSTIDPEFHELDSKQLLGVLDGMANNRKGLDICSSYGDKIAIKVSPDTLPRYSYVHQLDLFLNLSREPMESFGRIKALLISVQHGGDYRSWQTRSFNPEFLSILIHWLRIFWGLKELLFVQIRLPESEVFSLLQRIAGFCPSITKVVLNGKEYNPKLAIDYQLSRVQFYKATTNYQPKVVFTDLVDDVLLLIFRGLPHPTLYALASVSKRIQFLALPSYFEKYKIFAPYDTVDLTGASTFSQYNELDALSGLLISVFVKNMNTFTCTFSHKGCTYFSLFHVHRLERFFSRLDSCKKVKIEFESPSPDKPHEVMRARWETAIMRLFNIIASKGCEKLELLNGGCRSADKPMNFSSPPPTPKSPSKPKRLSRILSFLPAKPAAQSGISSSETTSIHSSESPPLELLFQPAQSQPLKQGSLTSLSISTRSTSHLGEFLPPQLSTFLANNPYLTHLTFAMAGRSIHHLAGSVPALTHLEVSGHSPPEGVFEFLQHVPLLRRLKLSPSLQPLCEDFGIPPRFNLPKLEVIHSPSFYVAQILAGGRILPNLRSITIIQQPFSMIPYLPAPSEVKTITDKLSVYPNPPELIMEINLSVDTIWMPHELNLKRIQKDIWPNWLAHVSGLATVVLRGLARFNPHASQVFLLVLALFPGLKHLHIFTAVPLPAHLTPGHFHYDLIKSIQEKFPNLATSNLNKRPFSSYLTTSP